MPCLALRGSVGSNLLSCLVFRDGLWGQICCLAWYSETVCGVKFVVLRGIQRRSVGSNLLSCLVFRDGLWGQICCLVLNSEMVCGVEFVVLALRDTLRGQICCLAWH